MRGKRIKKVLLLDFDGVIINSMNECLLTSYNAFHKFENTGATLAAELSDISPSHRQFFYLNRKYIRPAGEYYLIHRAYADKIKISNSKSYHGLFTLHKDLLLNYQIEFFSERNRLRSVNLKKWLCLHSVYRHFADCWDSLTNVFDTYIVSNKDKTSIILLMNYFDLSINEDQIFGAENGNDKSIIIANLMAKTLVAPGQTYFIDDNVDNLISIKGLGVKLLQAMWGYGNSDEIDDPAIEKLYPINILQRLT